jgi:hypothetical protein
MSKRMGKMFDFRSRLYTIDSQPPEQYGEALRWLHLPLGVMFVALVWFLRLYLQAGPLRLVWPISGLSGVTLVLSFSLNPNLNFRVLTGLHQVYTWGKTFVTPIGERNPWTNITHLSRILFILTRQVKAGKSFFIWWNGTMMHFCTHIKEEHRGISGQL